MPASSKHNLDVLVEEAAYIMMYSMRGVIRQQPTVRSTCVCVFVCVCREAHLMCTGVVCVYLRVEREA